MNYIVAVQTPVDKVNSVSDILNLPTTPGATSMTPTAQTVTPTSVPGSPVTRTGRHRQRAPDARAWNSVNHYTVQRVIDIAANVDGRDLGVVAADIQAAIDEVSKGLPITIDDRSCRPERGDAELVPQPRPRHDPGGRAGLCAAGGAVPVLDRSVHHHDGGARRADRHPVDAGAVAHHDQRRVADGRDHVDRHLGVELDPGGELRQRSARTRGSRPAARR